MAADNIYMKTDLYTKAILTALVLLLAMIAFRNPAPVQAQNQQQYDVWIEPGFSNLRSPDGTVSVQGKLVVDRLTGNIWGFPTGTGGPYPVDTTSSTPPVSKPMYLGRFDFASMKK